MNSSTGRDFPLRILVVVGQYQRKVFQAARPFIGRCQDPATRRHYSSLPRNWAQVHAGSRQPPRPGLIFVVAVSKVFLSLDTGQILRKPDGGGSPVCAGSAAVRPVFKRVKRLPAGRRPLPCNALARVAVAPGRVPGACGTVLWTETNPPSHPAKRRHIRDAAHARWAAGGFICWMGAGREVLWPAVPRRQTRWRVDCPAPRAMKSPA